MSEEWRALLPQFDRFSYYAGVTAAFAEVVAAGVKPLALSHPYMPAERAQMWAPTVAIAAEHGVRCWLETDFLVTPLFPAAVTAGREVIFLAADDAVWAAYQALKVRQREREGTGRSPQFDLEIARAFGRLLGYEVSKIEALLGGQ